MAAAMPQANLKIIAGSGHNIHLEKTQLFASTVLHFLEGLKEAVPG
jgi:pimeloyl-ACP methyl ester carboxylesterase